MTTRPSDEEIAAVRQSLVHEIHELEATLAERSVIRERVLLLAALDALVREPGMREMFQLAMEDKIRNEDRIAVLEAQVARVRELCATDARPGMMRYEMNHGRTVTVGQILDALASAPASGPTMDEDGHCTRCGCEVREWEDTGDDVEDMKRHECPPGFLTALPTNVAASCPGVEANKCPVPTVRCHQGCAWADEAGGPGRSK